jgi:hypothetical protein
LNDPAPRHVDPLCGVRGATLLGWLPRFRMAAISFLPATVTGVGLYRVMSGPESGPETGVTCPRGVVSWPVHTGHPTDSRPNRHPEVRMVSPFLKLQVR